MTERKFVYRNSGGTRRTMIWEDDEPEIIHVLTQQDMTQTLIVNAAMRELHPRKSTNKLVARGVPMTVAEKAMREDWDDKDWAKWLDDPDNKFFRVWPGRIGK